MGRQKRTDNNKIYTNRQAHTNQMKWKLKMRVKEEKKRSCFRVYSKNRLYVCKFYRAAQIV